MSKAPGPSPHGDHRSRCGERRSRRGVAGRASGSRQRPEGRSVVRRREQLRRTDAQGREGRREEERRDRDRLRRRERPQEAVLAAPDGRVVEAVRRDHRAAHLRAPADPGQAGDQGRDQGRQRRPDPGHEPQHGTTSGRRHVGQRRLHPDSHRPQAGRARRAACKANNLNPCNVGFSTP